MEMSASSFKKEPSPLRLSKNGSTISSSSPFFVHTSFKPSDSLPSHHILDSSGVGNQRENFISFQQYSSPSALLNADIESGYVAPCVVDKPSAIKKSKRRENPLPMFVNGVCSEVVPLPSQKRKRVNGKAVGNDENAEKSAGHKQNANKWRPMDGQSFPLMSQVGNSQGILGMYGLDARTLDLSGYANDVSLEQLMAHQPGVSQKQDIRRPITNNNLFGAHLNTSLHNLVRPLQGETSVPSISMPKPVDSKPQKFTLDLEAPPVDEENTLHDMNNAKSFSSGSNMLFLDNRTQLSMQYPVETSYPPDFLKKFQHPPSESLGCLRRQVGMPVENELSSFDIVQHSHESINRSPPLVFSFNSGQLLQNENQCDNFMNSRMNNWYKTESPTMASLKNGLHLDSVGKFPFAVQPDIVEIKLVKKHRTDGFDIDLNKQSSEAEAAESIIDTNNTSLESSSLTPPEPTGKENVFSAQSSTVVPSEKQPDTATTSAYPSADQPMVASQVINHAMAVDEEVLKPVAESNDNKKDETGEKKNINAGFQSLPLQTDKQENAVDKQEPDSSCLPNNSAEASAKNGTEKQENGRTQYSEAVETAIASVSNSFPHLSLPDDQEAEDGWNEVPYSPGVQATARLLCKMACSLTPFYVENEDAGRTSPLRKGTSPIRRHGKATKTVGVHEIGSKANEEKQSWDAENLHKASSKAREGKESSTHANVKRNGSIHTPHESGPITPPRVLARNSPSSRSDGSSKSPVKENTVNELYGKVNRIRSGQVSNSSGLSKVLTNPYTKKESKGTHIVGSSTKLLFTSPSKCSSSLQRKNEIVCETKQSVQGDGLSKLPQPHTNTSKSYLTSQKTSSNYSVKPGYPAKAPRQVLPYVGEIRYGSK